MEYMYSVVDHCTRNTPNCHIASRVVIARASMNKLYKFLRSLNPDARAELVSNSYRQANENRDEAVATELVLLEHQKAFEVTRREVVKTEMIKVNSVCQLIEENASLVPSATSDSVIVQWNRARNMDASITRTNFINGLFLFMKKGDEFSRLFSDTDPRLEFCGKVLGMKRTIKKGLSDLTELLEELTHI